MPASVCFGRPRTRDTMPPLRSLLAASAAALLLLLSSVPPCRSLLRPQDSETRQVKSLDGVWRFRTSPRLDSEAGFRSHWFDQPLAATPGAKQEVIDMPVPSSYNDITQDTRIRDYVGWVWYERDFFIPPEWKKDRRVTIRFGSVHYEARVWVNGHPAVTHQGGHLPFEADIDDLVDFRDGPNRLTVAVNNTLTADTVPQGQIKWHTQSDSYPKGFFTLNYDFDFFNYAGIHRPVVLSAVPRYISISDIRVTVDVRPDLKRAVLFYEVDTSVAKKASSTTPTFVMVELRDRDGKRVGTNVAHKGNLTLDHPNLWWPNLMHEDPGYLYELKVRAHNQKAGEDVYRLKVGLRTVGWNTTGIYINHRRFYFRGFGRHEDADIRGKGLDLPTVAKDFNLLRWTGANSFRTSHYPYAEEIMDFADSNGIVVIDECPAVALSGFGNKHLLEAHKKTLTELISRDRNRPSVVMWSVANEPRASNPEAEKYFKQIRAHVKSLDATRPMTVVVNGGVAKDQSAPSADIIGINKYFSWYSDTGHLELIERQMANELRAWHHVMKRPILVTEYGADTIAGLHQDPAFVFTEEYQSQLLRNNHKAFDAARKEGILVGEMVWNFADFMTKQEVTRVLGNRKGVFTRQRQPKAAAHVLRRRYWALARADNASLVKGATNVPEEFVEPYNQFCNLL